jgi:hypothetical protein
LMLALTCSRRFRRLVIERLIGRVSQIDAD